MGTCCSIGHPSCSQGAEKQSVSGSGEAVLREPTFSGDAVGARVRDDARGEGRHRVGVDPPRLASAVPARHGGGQLGQLVQPCVPAGLEQGRAHRDRCDAGAQEVRDVRRVRPAGVGDRQPAVERRAGWPRG